MGTYEGSVATPIRESSGSRVDRRELARDHIRAPTEEADSRLRNGWHFNQTHISCLGPCG